MSAPDDMALLKRLEGIQNRTEPITPLWRELCAERREAKASVQRLVGALNDLIEDVTDAEHLPHDWSEQVAIRQAKVALASVPAHLLAKEETKP